MAAHQDERSQRKLQRAWLRSVHTQLARINIKQDDEASAADKVSTGSWDDEDAAYRDQCDFGATCSGCGQTTESPMDNFYVDIGSENEDSNDEDDDDDDEEYFSSDIDNSDYEDLIEMLHSFDGGRPPGFKPPPPYPHNPLEELECCICFEKKKLRKRMCCLFPVCDECMEMYLITQVSQGIVKIECLNTKCSSYVHRDEILARLPTDMKEKFYKFLVDANKDPHVKTCPRCSQVMKLTGHEMRLNGHLIKLSIGKSKTSEISQKDRRKTKSGIKVACTRCELEWCFPCQAPYHEGISCKQFRKGDRLVRSWADEYHYGQLNAQKCPKCKIFIQRTTGCDHMTCSHCRTNFCYRCGDRYWGVKLLGDHFSRFSPFGCKYNFMPDRPHTRRLVRGAVLSGKLLGGLVLAGFALAAGAAILGLGVVALPAIGGYRWHKKRRRRRFEKHYARVNFLGRTNYRRTSIDQSVMQQVRRAEGMDESEDGMGSRPEWLVVGMQLPDSKQVEVLVHRTISSNAEGEEQSFKTEITQPEENTVYDGSVVTVTDVREVKNEDGYTTVIAHIVSKPAKEESAQLDKETSLSEDEDEGRASKDSKPDGKGSNTDTKLPGEEKSFEPKSSAEETPQSHEAENSRCSPPKNTTGSKEDHRGSRSNSTKEDRRESREGEYELGAKESNGCFVNIFAKKLNSLQNSSHDVLQAKCQGSQKGSLKTKSGTWEKSRKKEINCTNGIDIKNLSAIMATQCSEIKGQGLKSRDTGFCVTDKLEVQNTPLESNSCPHLLTPGDIDVGDISEVYENGFVDADESAVSCDIVTYL